MSRAYLSGDGSNRRAVVHKDRPLGDGGVLVDQRLQPRLEPTRLPASTLPRMHRPQCHHITRAAYNRGCWVLLHRHDSIARRDSKLSSEGVTSTADVPASSRYTSGAPYLWRHQARTAADQSCPAWQPLPTVMYKSSLPRPVCLRCKAARRLQVSYTHGHTIPRWVDTHAAALDAGHT